MDLFEPARHSGRDSQRFSKTLRRSRFNRHQARSNGNRSCLSPREAMDEDQTRSITVVSHKQQVKNGV